MLARALAALALLAAAPALASTPVRAVVWDLDGNLLSDASIELPPGPARPAEQVFTNLHERGLVTLKWAPLGALKKLVVAEVMGVAHRWPDTTWVLSHTTGGKVWPNVGLSDTVVAPGDTLEWRLMKMDDVPEPLPPSDEGDVLAGVTGSGEDVITAPLPGEEDEDDLEL